MLQCYRSFTLIIVQRDATQSRLFIILQVHSTCFGCQPHVSSEVHKTVTTASGTVQLICVNNCPTRCNTKQSIYYSASSLYMFRVSTTRIIRSTQNCNYSLLYCAATSLQRGQASLATLEGGCCKKKTTIGTGGICTKNMNSTGGCSYSFVYSL